jgi:hypothetical protein
VFDYELADLWSEHAIGVTPSLKVDREKWAETSRRLREIDGLSEADLRGLLAFIRDDDFWRLNAISLAGLRKQGGNGCRKFENIRAAIKRAQPPSREEQERRDKRRRDAHDAECRRILGIAPKGSIA